MERPLPRAVVDVRLAVMRLSEGMMMVVMMMMNHGLMTVYVQMQDCLNISRVQLSTVTVPFHCLSSWQTQS